MKSPFILFVLLIATWLQTNAQTPLASAAEIVDDACRQARKEDKNVFVLFHASWCQWCRKLDTILNRPDVKPLFDSKYLTRHIVVTESERRKSLETPGGMDFLERHVPDSRGIPVWLILDANGKVLTDSRLRKPGTDTIGVNTGCPATRDEIDYFIRCLRNTSTLTQPDLQLIGQAFASIRNIPYD